MVKCKKRSDWIKWKDAIEAELASIYKKQVFMIVMPTPRGIFPMGYKWVFIQKQNKNGEVVRYKARLVAQGFMQWNLFISYECNNFSIFNIIGSTKSFIYAVDGRSDRISLWVTGFWYIDESSRWNRCTRSKGKSQYVLRKFAEVIV